MSNKNKNSVNVPSLSPTEQKIYSELYSERVITTDDVKGIIGQKAPDYITNLRGKGYIKKIRKGLYAIAPPDMIGEDIKPDKFLIANKVKDEYYISHHSALEIHGLAQTIHNRVYITSTTPSRSFRYEDIEYKFITTKHFFGFEEKNRLNSTLTVSDREKTILDCIRNIKYAGGLEELIKSLEGVPSLDRDKMTDYLDRIEENSLYQKTGFLLDELNIQVPIEDELLSKVGKRTYYIDESKDSYYVSKWNLMVPKRFKEWITSA
ncbi:MAG: type IV toxin-antitoxin system AbiEi family antitoxin domain-containing protein [Thermoplasmatota archaeon]